MTLRQRGPRSGCRLIFIQMATTNFSSHAAFIWSVADLLRGDFKQSDYGKATAAEVGRVLGDLETQCNWTAAFSKLVPISVYAALLWHRQVPQPSGCDEYLCLRADAQQCILFASGGW